MNRKIERHGEFVASLGDRLMKRYTDGGPALAQTTRVRPKRTFPPVTSAPLGRGGSFARTVRRMAFLRSARKREWLRAVR